MIFNDQLRPCRCGKIERTVSRQIKNTQTLSESQKSARVLTPDSFHRGTSQHGRQSSTGARHAEPILGPSVLLTLPPHPTRTHTTQPTQQKHTKHCRASPPSSQRLQVHAGSSRILGSLQKSEVSSRNPMKGRSEQKRGSVAMADPADGPCSRGS